MTFFEYVHVGLDFLKEPKPIKFTKKQFTSQKPYYLCKFTKLQVALIKNSSSLSEIIDDLIISEKIIFPQDDNVFLIHMI